MKKRTLSLRTQIFGVMALLVMLQSFALLFALGASRVFFMLDAEAFRLFGTTTQARLQAYNTSVGRLVSGMGGEVPRLESALGTVAQNAGVSPAALYQKDEAYNAAALGASEVLLRLLQNNAVSGAFVVLNGSNTEKTGEEAHSAVYIRNSAPATGAPGTANYLLEVGPIAVSQQRQITTSVNWKLDLALSGDDPTADYYTRPVAAATQIKNAEMERYGYWAPPQDILGDGQEVVCYTMPLRDETGAPYGVLGVEISTTLYKQAYLPEEELPYHNSFYTIAPVRENVVDLSWYIPSGPVPQVYLHTGGSLPLAPVRGEELFSASVEGLGEMYCSVHSITMYSRNSPFYGESWALIGFVPQDVLHETSSGVRSILITSILLTTLLSFAAILLLTFVTTRKISGLSRYVQSLTPYMDIRFKRTGIKEIDELTGAVAMLNKSVVKASQTTGKILELTLLPIGGYEVSSSVSYVILTEYIYRLLGIEPGVLVPLDEWKTYYGRLVETPAAGYEDIYRYEDGAGSVKWLRILQAATDTGCVGVVLDVSKDVEERRRLAHELDFDALTHLYSRAAFKREADLMMLRAPRRVGALVFADLDNLKYINDNFGHDMGDRLIIRAGEMFRQFEKLGGIACRISGDEFAIYLHGFDTKEQALAAIHKQFEANSAYTLLTPDGTAHRVRSSAGVAFYPSDSGNVNDLLKLADFAMYEAKHNRKGSVLQFSRESYTQNAYLLENREAINRLLDEGLIRFAYQPIVDVRTGEVFAYEALMRPLLAAFKSPAEILSVAAAQSKLGQLERLVMMTAFAAAKEHEEALCGCKLFINSIPSQKMSDEDHLYLQRNYAAQFKNIVIEITEAENDYPENLNGKKEFVQKTGMQLAIDDYGTGYSNDLRVLAVQPDIVKVDIALISGIDGDADKRQLVQNLLSFCKPRGILVVAEGVERREELATVIRLGVDCVQGYYTGRPDFAFNPPSAKIKREILALSSGK